MDFVCDRFGNKIQCGERLYNRCIDGNYLIVRSIEGDIITCALMIEDHVRHAAYFKWLERGCPSGKEFWFEAENEYKATNVFKISRRNLLLSPWIKSRKTTCILA